MSVEKQSFDRCAKSEPAKGTPEVPGGDIFGFTDATDIGDPCSWSFSVVGRARPASAPGSLDLDNYERHELRVKFSTPIFASQESDAKK